MPDIQFHRDGGEWTAVYLDGELERVGDHYLADEWLHDYAGVKVVDDSGFMRGGNSYNDVARTLNEVHEYMRSREDKLAEAASLRAQAAEFLQRATELEAS